LLIFKIILRRRRKAVLKKVVVVLLFAVMMLTSGLTAMAVYSPELPTEGGTDTSTCPRRCRRWARRGGYDYDYD